MTGQISGFLKVASGARRTATGTAARTAAAEQLTTSIEASTGLLIVGQPTAPQA